jgi:hypothetical protein
MLQKTNSKGTYGWLLVLVLLATGLALTGCSSTKPVPGYDTLEVLEAIKEKTADGEAEVKLTSGEKMKATMIHGDLKQVHWKDPDNYSQITVKTGDIDTITLVSHGKGATQGLGIGALTGMVLGGVAGFSDGDDPDGIMSFSAEAKAGAGAAGGALAGGLLGLIAGGASGSQVIYDFQP